MIVSPAYIKESVLLTLLRVKRFANLNSIVKSYCHKADIHSKPEHADTILHLNQ